MDIIQNRKLCLYIKDEIDIANVQETICMIYDVSYIGLFKEGDDIMIFLKANHNKKMSSKRVEEILHDICKIKKIKYLKVPVGKKLDEIGKFRDYVMTKKRRPRVQTSRPVSKINNLDPPPLPPLPLIKNRIIVDGFSYTRDVVQHSPDFIFHAIWGLSFGLWTAVAWVGPESAIVPSVRRGISSSKIDIIFDRQNSLCNMCQCDAYMGATYSNADIDHIIPLRLGGTSELSNLQLICVPCHRRKTALECKKIKNNVLIDSNFIKEPGTVYIAKEDINGFTHGASLPEKNPTEILEEKGGIFKLVY